ncbi:hypothetical protein F5Y09DRAFT_348247 [Xylaria sp. FL1042]|nr:hypothetical protein F5Y09DRAFT_348247 [Xylaria sp. FL1042]
MSSPNGCLQTAVHIILGQADAQLDGTTTVVKLPVSTLYGLDIASQDIIKRHVSSKVGHPVEFYLDRRFGHCLYIADIASIQPLWPRPCEARMVAGITVPELFEKAIRRPEVMNPPSGGIQRSDSRPPLRTLRPLGPPAPPSGGNSLRKRASEPETPQEVSEPGSNVNKKQKKKKRSGPRKPPNSFLLYRKDRYRQLIKEKPELSFGQASTDIAEEWNGKTDEEKKYWALLAAERRLAQVNEQQKTKTSPNEAADNSETHQHIDRQFPQKYLATPPDHSTQHHNMTQYTHPQTHQRQFLSGSASSMTIASSFPFFEHSVQSIPVSNMPGRSTEHHHAQPHHTQASHVMGSFAQTSQYLPINDMAHNREQTWSFQHPEINGPAVRNFAQPPINQTPQNAYAQGHQNGYFSSSYTLSTPANPFYASSEYSVQFPTNAMLENSRNSQYGRPQYTQPLGAFGLSEQMPQHHPINNLPDIREHSWYPYGLGTTESIVQNSARLPEEETPNTQQQPGNDDGPNGVPAEDETWMSNYINFD